MRPRLKPALHRAWRDAHTVQLGLDQRHAMLVEGLGPAEHRLLDDLDGTRDLPGFLALAHERGVSADRATRLVGLIETSGLLEDAAADQSPVGRLTPQDRDRLAPDLATWSLVHGDTDGGAALIGRRHCAQVRVEGAGRVGAAMAGLLVASGVGRLQIYDDSPTRAADLAPGGLIEADIGVPRGRALSRRLGLASVSVLGGLVELVVLCEPGPSAMLRSRELVAVDQPHLIVSIRETVGLIGPLVLPGRSCCATCLELERAGRDPLWPTVLAQALHRGQPWATVGVETVLASVVAAHAALVALVHLDGGGEPDPTRSVALPLNETWEIALPEGRLRRRAWAAHPLCGCGAAA